uniref:Uncharacterized protein n=1 Tax=Panagrolaimus sp. PS1159 TaxID=55785 RepID=A0AC35GSM4_9BILA
MEKTIKLVVVGDAYVGKTSLLLAYTEKQFIGNYETTIFDNWAVTVSIEQKRYTLNLFDTAGQEEYSHLRCLGYPHTDVFLLCFSLIDQNSLKNCESLWLPEIRKYVGEDVPILLVGTKEDLLDSVQPNERVDNKWAQQAAKDMGCVSYYACSALTHRGLKRVFDEAILHATGAFKTHHSDKHKSEPCCKIL